jgi:hypothetical protein
VIFGNCRKPFTITFGNYKQYQNYLYFIRVESASADTNHTLADSKGASLNPERPECSLAFELCTQDFYTTIVSTEVAEVFSKQCDKDCLKLSKELRRLSETLRKKKGGTRQTF